MLLSESIKTRNCVFFFLIVLPFFSFLFKYNCFVVSFWFHWSCPFALRFALTLPLNKYNVFPPCIKRDTWQPLHHNTAYWTQNIEHSRKHSLHYRKANCGEFGGTIVMTGGMPQSQDSLLYTVYKMTTYSTQ